MQPTSNHAHDPFILALPLSAFAALIFIHLAGVPFTAEDQRQARAVVVDVGQHRGAVHFAFNGCDVFGDITSGLNPAAVGPFFCVLASLMMTWYGVGLLTV